MKRLSPRYTTKTRIHTKQHTTIMKANKFIAGLLALSAAPLASAATFEITGATAFRRATIEAVNALYVNSALPYSLGHNKSAATDFINADFLTFQGTISGLGATTVRLSFNGSIEGLRAIAQPGQSGVDGTNGDAYYIKDSSVTITPALNGAVNANQFITVNADPSTDTDMDRAVAEMAFSDTDVAISPYNPALFTGGSPGVLVFSLVSNDGSGITNVTTQQYNSLLKNGFMSKSLFTGLSEDQSKLVFCTGRNDGSGTRSSYLAEMGFGVAKPVQQYLVVSSTPDQVRALQAVPAGGTNDSNGIQSDGVQLPSGSDIKNFNDFVAPIEQLFTSKSTVWGQDVDGNGGAFSGSLLRGHMAMKGDAVRVFDAEGFDQFGATISGVSLITWVSLNDAITARDGGANICAFNGVSLTVNPGKVLSAADKQKVYNGNYTAWNFQKFYRRPSADANTVTLYNSVFSSVANGNLGVAGLKNTDMKVGRPLDGGVINPIF